METALDMVAAWSLELANVDQVGLVQIVVKSNALRIARGMASVLMESVRVWKTGKVLIVQAFFAQQDVVCMANALGLENACALRGIRVLIARRLIVIVMGLMVLVLYPISASAFQAIKGIGVINLLANLIATRTATLANAWPLAFVSAMLGGAVHFVNGQIAPMIAPDMGCAFRSMMMSRVLTFHIATVQLVGRAINVRWPFVKGIAQIEDLVLTLECAIAMLGGQELCVRLQNVPTAALCMETACIARKQMKWCATVSLVGEAKIVQSLVVVTIALAMVNAWVLQSVCV